MPDRTIPLRAKLKGHQVNNNDQNPKPEKPKENIVPGKKIAPIEEPTPAKPERIASEPGQKGPK